MVFSTNGASSHHFTSAPPPSCCIQAGGKKTPDLFGCCEDSHVALYCNMLWDQTFYVILL